MQQIGNTSVIIPESPQGAPPKTWLVESILTTVFCCQILGIIGIVHAASVESKCYKGDIEGARKSSRLARQMVIWSMILWGIVIGTTVVFYIFVFVLAAVNGEWK